MKISEFKGKVVLIDAWATWCGPCRETMPRVQELYNEFKDQGLEVLAVSNETAPVVSRFLKDNTYTYPFYLDLDGSFGEDYKVESIPVAFVIDKNGNIVFRGHPGDHQKLRTAIVEALKGS